MFYLLLVAFFYLLSKKQKRWYFCHFIFTFGDSPGISPSWKVFSEQSQIHWKGHLRFIAKRNLFPVSIEQWDSFFTQFTSKDLLRCFLLLSTFKRKNIFSLKSLDYLSFLCVCVGPDPEWLLKIVQHPECVPEMYPGNDLCLENIVIHPIAS